MAEGKKDVEVDDLDDDLGDFDIEIVDETPEEDRNRPLLADDEIDDDADVDDDDNLDDLKDHAEFRKRLRKLTYQKHDFRRKYEATANERDEAVTMAQRLYQQLQQVSSETGKMKSTLSKSQRESAQAAIEKAKADYRAAYDEGDVDKQIEAQQRISEATFRLNSLGPEQEEPETGFQPTQPQNQAPVQQPQQPQRQQLSPKQRDWLKRNPWFGQAGHEQVTSFAFGVHDSLVQDGIVEGSDEYFAKVDEEIGRRFPEYRSGGNGEQRQNARRQSAVAPAGRVTGNGSRKRVQLTQAQVSFAKRANIPLEDMAKEILKLEEQGDV